MLTANWALPAPRLSTLSRRHWPSALLLATMFGLYLLAGLSVVGIGGPDGRALAKVSRDLPAAALLEAPPKPEPLAFREIEPRDAVAFNAAIPVSATPNPAARPFVLAARTEADRQRSIECLTSAVYYEAGSESADGQRAVAQVVLNRVRHPAYPNSVCGVVFEGSERATGCQFTFTCDGSLRRTPSVAGWQRARTVAEAALAGRVFGPVGWATHYHTNWVVPYWSSSLVKAANIGTHIFYRWTGGWGRGPAFRTPYAGAEPVIRPLGEAPATLAAGEAGMTDALAEANAKNAAAGSVDSFQRAVLRRYEPATRQGVAAGLAAQAGGGQVISPAYRWAMTGDNSGSKQAPLGKKLETAAATPACLEGVRKAGSSEADAAKPLAC